MRERLTKKNKIRLALSVLLLLLGGGWLFCCRFFENVADWYVKGPFQFFPNVAGRVTGLFPFSLYEVVLYLLAAALLWKFCSAVACLIQRRKPGSIQNQLCGGICFAAAVFCAASLTCLCNYGRSPLSEELGLSIHPSSVEDLKQLCEELACDAESVMDEINRDEEGRFTLGDIDVKRQTQKAMYRLGSQYDVFEGYYPKPKPVLWSEGMSYINLTGMYSPFTIEANYNAAVSDYVIPYTICHELAHLRGLIREDEAGFSAWLACYLSDSPQLQYSGAVNALRYVLNALYREVEYEEYAELYNGLPIEIRWDMYQNSQYWKRHQGMTYEIGYKINDTYLKANAQKGGAKSYGRMIDLLLAYRKSGAELT